MRQHSPARVTGRGKLFQTPLQKFSCNNQLAFTDSRAFGLEFLNQRYNLDLWSSQLRAAFPNLPAMETRPLIQIRRRYRRVTEPNSHHEPIFMRNLLTDFSEMMRLLP